MSEGTGQLQSLFSDSLQLLKQNPDMTAQQMAFIELTRPMTMVDGLVIIAAPNDFTRDVVSQRLEPQLREALSNVMQQDIRLAFVIDENMSVNTADDEPEPTPVTREPDSPVSAPSPTPEASSARRATQDDETPDRLNPKFVFESFVIGSSNRFAHAAAVAVAEQPAKAYNPLFVYGDSGLGKTHLLHAIGHYSRDLYANSRVRYVTSEEFTNEFINSIRDDRNRNFHARYRNVDVLLIDDIQFLSGKVQTQEEFFHTFNTLHNANKQIVITSDLHPKKLPDFEDRMRSRFEWGLITDIQPPDTETRIAILRKKKQQENFEVPEEVLRVIAERIASNIRELEGALIRVKAFASLNRSPVDIDIANHVLDGLLPEGSGPEITVQLIIDEASSYFGVDQADLMGSSRSRSLVQARQIAMYLCRELTNLSLPKIGQSFGGRDHTTVMHAERKIRSQMAERRSLYNQVSELTSRIKSQAAT